VFIVRAEIFQVTLAKLNDKMILNELRSVGSSRPGRIPCIIASPVVIKKNDYRRFFDVASTCQVNEIGDVTSTAGRDNGYLVEIETIASGST
jgi:hypothetical protein